MSAGSSRQRVSLSVWVWRSGGGRGGRDGREGGREGGRKGGREEGRAQSFNVKFWIREKQVSTGT